MAWPRRPSARGSASNWWLWGTLTTVLLLVGVMVAGPVWIDPLFNTYKPVEDGPVKAAVLAMAHANEVPGDNIFEFDASGRTRRVSANVSGLFGSAAVRLNDNLLRRSSLPEIRAVMAHELGHHVMHHILKMLLQVALLFAAGFLFAQWAMRRLLARHGARLGLGGVSDVATLPLFNTVNRTAWPS